VAQIVGARTQRPAVTFSAPGVVLSRRKFNIELHDINNYLVNVRTQTFYALSGYGVDIAARGWQPLRMLERGNLFYP
jgi:hypothetical protein